MPHDLSTPVRRHPLPSLPRIVGSVAFIVGLLVFVESNRIEIGLIVRSLSLLWSTPINRAILVKFFLRMILTGSVFSLVARVCFFLVTRYQPQDMENAQHQMPTSHHSMLIASGQHSPVVFQTLPPVTCASEISNTAFAPAGTMQEQASHQSTNETARMPDNKDQSQDTPPMAVPTIAPPEDEDENNGVSIEISLLKTIQMDLCVPQLHKRYPIKIDDLYPKARHLIAYIAWRQGASVKLDQMRFDVFGSEDAETKQVQDSFSTAKRDIRRRIGQAIEQANSEATDAGVQGIPQKLGIFALAKNHKYFLPDYCHVRDLACIEAQQRLIEEAEDANQLVTTIPAQIKQACDILIASYSGDFIEDLLAEDPDVIDPWVQHWAREPFTQYRDYYLQALLYAGEYERKTGDDAQTPAAQREHFHTAARLFVQGAMAACKRRICDGRFDTKVFFAKTSRRAGQHVALSEQFIRRAIALYGKIGSTMQANRAYGAYEQQMLYVSGRAWSAQPETTDLLESALKQTGAYHFPDTIATPYDRIEVLAHNESA